MNEPHVSICLPSLNTFPYLQERIDTILAQTYSNWELIVVDCFSDDGSWELFEKLAQKDQRVSIAQAPRGLYATWNNCIEQATGKYVYIATSDDTMAADCIEKLVVALEEHDECDLAHCPLRIIDKNGTPITNSWWADASVFARGIPELQNRRHLRRAPYDGLLHLSGALVFVSITELLIRRSLFGRIGGFETRWGSMGDVNWDMKAGLVANTIHVPDTWATLRMHAAQATASLDPGSPAHAHKIEEMINDALLTCEAHLVPEVVAGLKNYWLNSSYAMRRYYSTLRKPRSAIRKRLFQASQIFTGEKIVRFEMMDRLLGRSKWVDRVPGEIRGWLDSLGLGPAITDLTECSGDSRARHSSHLLNVDR